MNVIICIAVMVMLGLSVWVLIKQNDCCKNEGYTDNCMLRCYGDPKCMEKNCNGDKYSDSRCPHLHYVSTT